jgi:hypothetical protein
MFQRNYGQVAQLVERSPEKAGVGGSIPSLATTFSNTYKYPKTHFHSISFLAPQVYLHGIEVCFGVVYQAARILRT